MEPAKKREIEAKKRAFRHKLECLLFAVYATVIDSDPFESSLNSNFSEQELVEVTDAIIVKEATEILDEYYRAKEREIGTDGFALIVHFMDQGLSLTLREDIFNPVPITILVKTKVKINAV